MGTVIFDFDSVLVPCESLEVVLERCGLDPAARAEVEALTAAGMEGRLSFEESLRRRLAFAQPRLEVVEAVGRELARAPTRGARELVAALRADGHEVWIVSGGFRDLLTIVGVALGVDAHRIHGVRADWRPGGPMLADDGFAVSKVEGLRRLAPTFAPPVVGVGDGATDLALREAGFVDRFVAYTEHARRAPVVAAADVEARSMEDLAAVLPPLLL